MCMAPRYFAEKIDVPEEGLSCLLYRCEELEFLAGACLVHVHEAVQALPQAREPEMLVPYMKLKFLTTLT